MGGRLKLGQILVNRGLLEPDQLSEALAAQQEAGARLGTTLVRLGLVDEETLIRTLAGLLKLPVARIRGKRVSPDVLELVPVAIAEKHRCLPLFLRQEPGGRALFVAMEDPSDAEALEALAHASGEAVRAVLVGPTELEEALQRHYEWASPTGESPEWLSVASPGGVAAPAEPEPEESQDEPSDAGREAAAEPSLPLDADAELGAAPDVSSAETAPEIPEDDGGPDPAEEWDAGREPAILADLDLAPREPASPGSGALRPESLDPGVILRALSQLLVEKGFISRDEFVQRLGELAARDACRG